MFARLSRFAPATLLVLLTVFVLTGHKPTLLDSAPTEIEYCNSPTAPKTLADASQCDYKPRDSFSLQLLKQPVKWARINIDTTKLSTQDLAIYIFPHFIRSISLYTPKTIGDLTAELGWHKETAGSSTPSDASILGGYAFVVTPPTTQKMFTCYIRIESYETPYVAIDVQPWPSVQIQNQVWVGAYLGALLLILALSCFSLTLDPNPLMRRFTIYCATVFLSVLISSGFLTIYIGPRYAEFFNPLFRVLLCLRLATWVWLAMGFLAPYPTPVIYRASCILAISIALICVPLHWVAIADTTLPVLLACTIAISSIQIWTLLRTKQIEVNLRVALAIGYAITLLVMLCIIFIAAISHQEALLPIQLIRISDFMAPLLLLMMVVIKNRQSVLELNLTRTQLLEANLQAEAKLKMLAERRMLVDMLTHELKNPLASIGFAASSLAHGGDMPYKSRRLESIHLSIKNMDAIIERCSLINALEHGELTPKLSRFNLSELAQSIVDALPLPHRVLLNIDHDMIITSDRNLLRIIFVNLLDNALKYSAIDSTIDLFLYAANNRIYFTLSNQVDDTLMPAESKLFSRFYRHPNAHHISGTGLGLFLVHELSQRLNGTVHFLKMDKSVTFEVTIPYAD